MTHDMDTLINQISSQTNSLSDDYQEVKKRKEETTKALKNQEAAVERLKRSKTEINDEIMLLRTKNIALKDQLEQKTSRVAALKSKAANAQKEVDNLKEMMS